MALRAPIRQQAPGDIDILSSQPSSALLTRLLTILNTSAARPSALKRKRDESNDWHAIAQRVKTDETTDDTTSELPAASPSEEADDPPDEQDVAADGFDQHFGVESPLITDAALDAVKVGRWDEGTLPCPSGLGHAVLSTLHDVSLPALIPAHPVSKLASKLDRHLTGSRSPEREAMLDLMTSYRDILSISSAQSRTDQHVRAAAALHAMSHLVKGSRRVLSNNELLAKAAAEKADVEPSTEIRDQGYTRPKVLILLPFRNAAIAWMAHLSRVAPSVQVENRERFMAEFSLPPGSLDKLAQPEARERYPPDHIAIFRGNIDDSFRVGLRATRKSLRIFSEFYGSDIIMASPLGLRKSIDQSGCDRTVPPYVESMLRLHSDSDFLSSIEMVIADQLDVMLMQNWDHVRFIFDRLNKLPEASHDTDFARVKPWYLEGRAAMLRQTILFSAFETPEVRCLFNRHLRNIAGRIRLESPSDGILSLVRQGVKQAFTRFEASDATAEVDARFDEFTKKTLPALLSSAVMSSHTLIFVPSYFDFVRLNAHMKALTDVSFATLSEYTDGSDIARARTLFENGSKSFLLMTERFHFFRRFRVRGANTIVFYGLPEHAQFYAELVNTPFMPSKSKDVPDASEVTVQALFSRYDAMRLARIVGDGDARRMCSEAGATRFSFV